jgi:hypothetical protein
LLTEQQKCPACREDICELSEDEELENIRQREEVVLEVDEAAGQYVRLRCCPYCLIDHRSFIKLKNILYKFTEDMKTYCYYNPIICLFCCVLQIFALPIMSFYEFVYYRFGLQKIPYRRLRYFVGSIIMFCIICLCILFSRLIYAAYSKENLSIFFGQNVNVFFFKVLLGFVYIIVTLFALFALLSFIISCCFIETSDLIIE